MTNYKPKHSRLKVFWKYFFKRSKTWLEKTLAAYYRSFAEDFFEAKRYSFYRELYQMTVGGLDMICRTTLMLLEPHAVNSQDGEEKAIMYYVTALSILVHDARLERVDVDLGGNELDQAVDRLLQRLATIHSDLVISRKDQGAMSYLTVRSDRVRYSLPYCMVNNCMVNIL